VSPLSIADLAPFRSFVIAQRLEQMPTVTVNAVMAQLWSDFPVAVGATRTSKKKSLESAQLQGAVTAAFWHYIEEQAVRWATGQLEDVVHQLVVVVRRGDYFLFSFTDNTVRGYLSDSFGVTGTALGSLAAIPPDILNAGFVSGSARTLWLSGAHRRTAVKADTKVLSGVDLRDALDPLEDQSYYFTAARSTPIIGGAAVRVGVSPFKSLLWFGFSHDWNEYITTAHDVLVHVAGITIGNPAPLPVVAVASTSLSGVASAYDMALAPPELDDPLGLDAQRRALLEKWAFDASFDVAVSPGPAVAASVRLGQALIGSVDVTITAGRHLGDIAVDVKGSASAGNQAAMDELLGVLSNRHNLKIWYESGHTIADGTVHEVRYRDLAFRSYEWRDFAGFDITREKPTALNLTGQQDSLFCWVKQRWAIVGGQSAGWLACDDGANEVADFVHLSMTAAPPLLSLIHVKSAQNGAANRQLAVSPFEVVASQAVKNLRFLDRDNLVAALGQRVSQHIGQLVWRDGQLSPRAAMVTALAQVGANCGLQIVIVQPQLVQNAVTVARNGQAGASRLRQLEALLASAESACRSLGAQLTVIGEA
jgi:hypothetical protein